MPRPPSAALVVAFLLAAAARADAPAIRLVVEEGQCTITVTGLDGATLKALARHQAFSVHVDRPGKSREGQPAMLGSYRTDKGVLRFTPRFPLTPGLRYRAVLDLAKLPGGKGKAVEVVLSLPRPATVPSTTVARVYPSGDRLPENLLRFYLHFSAPMSQGDSYRHVKLLDAKGKGVELPFLELDQELWNPAGTRLTLFLDPGRVKRGLKPREDDGPVLEEGKRFTLVIDRNWKDARGAMLNNSFRKGFSVTAPDDRQPDPKGWKIIAPGSATSSALRVTFARPLDHALLQRMLWVIDGNGKKVPGTVTVAEKETAWLFKPARPWARGSYHLVADTRLEDRSGNSIGRPFEVDSLRKGERKIPGKTVKLPFAVK